MLGSIHSLRPRLRRSEFDWVVSLSALGWRGHDRLVAEPVKGEAEYYSPLHPSAFGCVAVVAWCWRGGLGRLGLAFEGGCVADPVDEGPVLVGRDRMGLGVDGSGPLGVEGGVVVFEAALQGGFVEVLDTGL